MDKEQEYLVSNGNIYTILGTTLTLTWHNTIVHPTFLQGARER